jgi:hypothetical protein
MCDYSLHNIRTRKAVEGEPLQVHRFPTGSLGLASPNDLQPRVKKGASETPEQSPAKWWQAIKNWFEVEPAPEVPAVCVSPGTQLILREIPSAVRQKFDVKEEEMVTFVQLNPTPSGYRDAIRFSNGKELLLQRLPKGLQVDVLRLSGSDEPEPMPEEPSEIVAFGR